MSPMKPVAIYDCEVVTLGAVQQEPSGEPTREENPDATDRRVSAATVPEEAPARRHDQGGLGARRAGPRRLAAILAQYEVTT